MLEDIVLHESWSETDKLYIKKRLGDFDKKTIEFGEDYIYNDETNSNVNIGKCLVHKKSKNKKSVAIGIISLKKTINKKTMAMHRFILFCKFGNLNSKVITRHKCKTKNCYNPDHVEPGSQYENMKDKIRDGTNLDGEKNPASNSTNNIIKEIYDATKELTNAEIMAEFNISKYILSRITTGKSWSSVTGIEKKIKIIKKLPREEILELILKNKEDLLKKIKKNIKINKKGCWLWQLSLNRGYGIFSYMNTPFSSHLISWMIATNQILQKDLCIRHKCINQKDCCNPEHLCSGTYSQNALDTSRKGEEINTSKLKKENVLEIYKLLEQKISIIDISEKFDVTEKTVRCIKNGTAWSHLYTIENYKNIDINKKRKNKFKDKDVLEIYKLLENKLVIFIAKQYNVSRACIYNIKYGRTWKKLYKKYYNICEDEIEEKDKEDEVEKNEDDEEKENIDINNIKGKKKGEKCEEKHVLEIYKLLENKYSVKIIAEKYNSSTSCIYRIKKGVSHKHLYTKKNYKDCKI